MLVTVNAAIPPALGYIRPFHVIPPGVDAERFRPLDRQLCREKLGLPAKDLILFFPAHPASPTKGFTLLKEAVALLPTEVHLIAAGEIRHADMPLYINAADLVVQPSQFEASPMILKEVMACNRPMVLTAVGDAREIVGDTPGYTFCQRDPNDIAAAIQKRLQATAAVAGRKRILSQNLSLAATAKTYLHLYHELARLKDS
jgi:glycosyltransferase involved in cell wall biosynthesis